MTHDTHPDVINRLKRAHGHLASTIAMIEGGRNCLEVAQQMHAVIKALEGAKAVFIHDHLGRSPARTALPSTSSGRSPGISDR
jgi:uncharacterized protein